MATSVSKCQMGQSQSTAKLTQAEKDEIQLVREFSQVWENPKFHIAGSKERPAILLTSAKPLLNYAAQKIMQLREQHGVSSDEVPLVGRAQQYLTQELGTSCTDDITKFIKQIICHALQTPDGDFVKGISCADVDKLVSADPPVFSCEEALSEARNASDKIDQLLDELVPLKEDLAEFSALQSLTRKLRALESRLVEIKQVKTESKKQPVEALPSRELRRTQSQQANRVQVQKVKSHLAEKASPIAELKKTLGLLGPTENISRRRRLLRSMRKRGREFHEDLMNLMFSLDDMKMFDEADRVFRKETINKVQDMLDELDAISGAVEDVSLKQGPIPATPPGEMQITPQEKEKIPTDVKKIDWQALKLPVRFDSRTTPQAYLLLASLAGLDLTKLKLTVATDEDSLRVEGYRPPDDVEKKSLEDTKDVYKALAEAQGRFGTFKEEFQLPSDVQASDIYAEYNRGILRVVIPRSLSATRPVEKLFGIPSDFFEGEFWW